MTRLIRLLIIAVVLGAAAQAVSQCGPPTYACANTTQATLPLGPLPNVGNVTGAGTVVTDPTLKYSVSRLTDANTGGTAQPNVTWTISNGGSGDDNWWNTDDTMLLVGNTGGWVKPMSFNPVTLQGSPLYALSLPATNGFRTNLSDVQFSRVNPAMIIAISGSTLCSFTFDPPAFVTVPSCAFIFDFVESTGNCLPLDFGTPTWIGGGGVGAGDSWYSAAFSSVKYHYGVKTGQGSGFFVAAYVPGKGCFAVNTSTGAITADVGFAGGAGLTCTASGCTGTIGIADRYSIHNIKSATGPASGAIYINVVRTTCLSTCSGDGTNPYLIQVGTNGEAYCCVTKQSGHWVGGQQDIVNSYTNSQFAKRTYAGPGLPATMVSPSPAACSGLGNHAGWMNADSTDATPVAVTTAATMMEAPYDAPACPWWNEVYMVDANGDGLTKRFTRTFNTAQGVAFATQQAIGSVSQTGNFISFSSDWMNTLGSLSGGNVCIPSGPAWTSRTYPFGYALTPPSAVNAGNYSFQAIVGGTSAASQPTWPQSVDATVVDSGVTWKNIGIGNCRGDAFAVRVSQPAMLASAFGFTETSTAAANFPTVSYGMQRIWDSPPLQWPSINTAPGVFNFANLDAMLAQDYTNGVRQVLYTLARTPPWATSQPSDTMCHYQLPAVGGGPGECYPPSDLNADGSGTNATWKAWVTALAAHVNDPTYLKTHTRIGYYEIWNEPDAAFYWSGSFAQLARMTEDANCIITGRGVIHQNGNGSATVCMATAIDPTGVIVMASGHASSPATLKYAQNQLYCNNTVGIPTYQLPCPNPLNATAAAFDVVNFHMKPGNAYPATLENTLTNYVTNINGILQAAELAKPLWDGETSYAEGGFVPPYDDADMGASIFPRLYLMAPSQGISVTAWYTWDDIKKQSAQVIASYRQTFSYLVGSALTVPCAATGTVYRCTLMKNGVSSLVLWDNSKSCSGGACTTGEVAVPSQWVTYHDMTSASSPIAISGGLVPVGIKPVILQSTVTTLAPAPATNVVVKIAKNNLSSILNGGTL